MIVVDSSALVAIAFGEPDYSVYADALASDRAAVSGVTLAEASIVVESRLGPPGAALLDQLVSQLVDDVVDVDRQLALAAVAAWRRFGKGRHPARLNLGDCFAYATAKLAGAPLLFKGDDFAQTDLASAL